MISFLQTFEHRQQIIDDLNNDIASRKNGEINIYRTELMNDFDYFDHRNS